MPPINESFFYRCPKCKAERLSHGVDPLVTALKSKLHYDKIQWNWCRHTSDNFGNVRKPE